MRGRKTTATASLLFVFGALPAGRSATAAVPPPADSPEEPDDNPYEPQEPAPHHAPAPPRRPNFEVREGMVHIPGGTFVMGSSSTKSPPNERPARKLSVGAFWIDKTEVTVSEYRHCIEAGLCETPRDNAATCTNSIGDPALPISCVRWNDANRYCEAQKKRLPTEAEWEFAARGTSPVRFPWGWSSTSCAIATTLISDNSGRSCAPHPSPAESKPQGASPFGVLNMAGNVEEWTADWYTESPGGTAAPRVGTSHVLRGGGWLSPPSMSTTTARDWGSAVEAGPNIGFRCAKDSE